MNDTIEFDESGKWLVILGEQGEACAKAIRALQRMKATPLAGNVWLVHQDHYENSGELLADISKQVGGIDPTKMILTWYFTNEKAHANQWGYSSEFNAPMQSDESAINLHGRG